MRPFVRGIDSVCLAVLCGGVFCRLGKCQLVLAVGKRCLRHKRRRWRPRRRSTKRRRLLRRAPAEIDPASVNMERAEDALVELDGEHDEDRAAASEERLTKPQSTAEYPSPWQTVKNGTHRAENATASAWHKTVAAVTPGSNAPKQQVAATAPARRIGGIGCGDPRSPKA